MLCSACLSPETTGALFSKLNTSGSTIPHDDSCDAERKKHVCVCESGGQRDVTLGILPSSFAVAVMVW